MRWDLNRIEASTAGLSQRHKEQGTAPFLLHIGVALVDGSCRFFRQKKKEEKEKRQTARNISGPGPSFFFLCFLPDNPLARRFGGPVPSHQETAGANELNEWPLSIC
jgi:hypothetical protein